MVVAVLSKPGPAIHWWKTLRWVGRVIGQLRSPDGCPVCSGANGGKWVCLLCMPILKVHREMLRNLQAWTSGYESQLIPEVLIAGDGNSYCLWDLKEFYAARKRLPHRMSQAIEMCLYENMLEREVAVQMGLSPSNPVSIYANVGLARLLSWAYLGELGHYNPWGSDQKMVRV